MSSPERIVVADEQHAASQSLIEAPRVQTAGNATPAISSTVSYSQSQAAAPFPSCLTAHYGASTDTLAAATPNIDPKTKPVAIIANLMMVFIAMRNPRICEFSGKGNTKRVFTPTTKTQSAA